MHIKKTSSRDNRRRGFSLLELLLVMTLAPILFFAVFSNFSTGVKLWTKVVRETPEEDLNIFSFKARRDLEHLLRFSPMPFNGDSAQVLFACAIETKPSLGSKNGIGEVKIFYDDKTRQIAREERNISEFYREAPARRSVLLREVSSFELSYLSKEPLESGYAWSEDWKPAPNKLPVAIKMSLELENLPGKYERVVFIPVGGEIKG